MKTKTPLWLEKIMYYGAYKYSIYLLLICSIVSICVLIFTEWRPVTLSTDNRANEANGILLALSGSYICSCIFYLVNNYLPSYWKRETERSYVQQKLSEINSILKHDVEFLFFFQIEKPEITLEGFLDEFISHDGLANKILNNGNNLYDSYIKNQDMVCNTARELLRVYERYLSFDQIKKLEYISKNYYLNRNLTHALIQLKDGSVGYDSNLLKLEGIQIYKAYDIMKSKRFRVPEYQIEKELGKEIFQ